MRYLRISAFLLATSVTVGTTTLTAMAATKSAAKPSSKSSTPTSTGKKTGGAKVGGLRPPNGRPTREAAPFDWTVASTDPAFPNADSFEAATTAIVPENRLFKLLIIGSDARPNENFQKTRADSIHILVWNPAFNKGILVGIPRDSYVTIKPSGKKDKINSSLGNAGPEGVLATVNALSGLKIQNYVITGFKGFRNIVNDIGGINVLVDPAMNDKFSGARFQKGWFAMDGGGALAFSRNRHGLAGGDFERSMNQGKMLLAGLAKLREETSTAPEMLRWIDTFRRNGATNLKPTDMLLLMQIARSIDPANMQNVVLQGKPGNAGKASVVLLNQGYVGLFEDIGRDAVNDGK